MYSAIWRKTALIVAAGIALWAATLLSAASAAPSTTASSADGTITVPWQDQYGSFNALLVEDGSGHHWGRYPVIEGQGWVISGLPDGVYSLSLATDADQQPILSVQVNHYPLNLAFGLFGFGLLMFVYLIITLNRGGRDRSHD